jgi:TPR repeat protein
MKRAVLATIFLAALTFVGSAAADSVSDQEMASRYSQAAQAGDGDAQFYLGALYSAGVGEPRSDETAFRWFSRAADQGHSHAMLVLSGLYAIGRGIQKDNIKAYKWAFIVSSNSRTEEFRNGARQLMGLLENKMTPTEISQAKLDAGGYQAAAPSVPIAPSAAQIRVLPPPTAIQPAPAPPPSPAKTANDTAKKDDLDGILDNVPQGLRKKFGF